MNHKGACCIYRCTTAADWFNHVNAASILSSLSDLLPRIVSSKPLSFVGVVYRHSRPYVVLLNKEVSVYIFSSHFQSFPPKERYNSVPYRYGVVLRHVN